VFPANLGHGLALVLLTQNPQNLGFAKTTLFHEQLKIEKVKSYYFSLFLTGLLTGGAYKFNQTLRIICQRMPLMDKVSMKTLTIGNRVTQKPYRKWQRMSSHVARKTFVENAVAKGVELIAIAEWLGHVDTVMLQKHYANKRQIAKREAVKLLA